MTSTWTPNAIKNVGDKRREEHRLRIKRKKYDDNHSMFLKDEGG